MTEANNNKQNPEQQLREGRTIQIKPQGWSMYPLFVPGRDYAIIEPVGQNSYSSLRRGDVVVYRREGSILVIHRIYKVDSQTVYMVGDNQTQIEGPLMKEQVRGKMTAFIRNGKSYSTRNIIYRMYSVLWLFLRPVRRPISTTGAAIRKGLKL